MPTTVLPGLSGLRDRLDLRDLPEGLRDLLDPPDLLDLRDPPEGLLDLLGLPDLPGLPGLPGRAVTLETASGCTLPAPPARRSSARRFAPPARTR